MTVKYTFRYDQIMNCEGDYNIDLLNSINKGVSEQIKENKCCVSYDVNWGGYITSDLFCSKIPNNLKCLTEIELFRKTILNKCISKGVKQLFKYLSTFDFDFESWIIKATSQEKIRFYNVFRILKNYKVLFYKNEFYFRSIKKYLDYFSVNFLKNYSVLEKHGIFLTKNLYENQLIRRNQVENMMTSIQEDTFQKVLEDIIEQSIDTEITVSIRKVLKEIIYKFSSFFQSILSHKLVIDLKPFIRFTDNDSNSINFEEVKKELIKFVFSYNNSQNNKKNCNKDSLIPNNSDKVTFISEEIKRNLFGELNKYDNKGIEPKKDLSNFFANKKTFKSNNFSKYQVYRPYSNSNSNEKNVKDLREIEIDINNPNSNMYKYNIQIKDVMKSKANLNIIDESEKNDSNRIFKGFEYEREKRNQQQLLSPEVKKKLFILEQINKQNLENIESLTKNKKIYNNDNNILKSNSNAEENFEKESLTKNINKQIQNKLNINEIVNRIRQNIISDAQNDYNEKNKKAIRQTGFNDSYINNHLQNQKMFNNDFDNNKVNYKINNGTLYTDKSHHSKYYKEEQNSIIDRLLEAKQKIEEMYKKTNQTLLNINQGPDRAQFMDKNNRKNNKFSSYKNKQSFNDTDNDAYSEKKIHFKNNKNLQEIKQEIKNIAESLKKLLIVKTNDVQNKPEKFPNKEDKEVKEKIGKMEKYLSDFYSKLSNILEETKIKKTEYDLNNKLNEHQSKIKKLVDIESKLDILSKKVKQNIHQTEGFQSKLNGLYSQIKKKINNSMETRQIQNKKEEQSFHNYQNSNKNSLTKIHDDMKRNENNTSYYSAIPYQGSHPYQIVNKFSSNNYGRFPTQKAKNNQKVQNTNNSDKILEILGKLNKNLENISKQKTEVSQKDLMKENSSLSSSSENKAIANFDNINSSYDNKMIDFNLNINNLSDDEIILQNMKNRQKEWEKSMKKKGKYEIMNKDKEGTPISNNEKHDSSENINNNEELKDKVFNKPLRDLKKKYNIYNEKSENKGNYNLNNDKISSIENEKDNLKKKETQENGYNTREEKTDILNKSSLRNHNKIDKLINKKSGDQEIKKDSKLKIEKKINHKKVSPQDKHIFDKEEVNENENLKKANDNEETSTPKKETSKKIDVIDSQRNESNKNEKKIRKIPRKTNKRSSNEIKVVKSLDRNNENYKNEDNQNESSIKSESEINKSKSNFFSKKNLNEEKKDENEEETDENLNENQKANMKKLDFGVQNQISCSEDKNLKENESKFNSNKSILDKVTEKSIKEEDCQTEETNDKIKKNVETSIILDSPSATLNNPKRIYNILNSGYFPNKYPIGGNFFGSMPIAVANSNVSNNFGYFIPNSDASFQNSYNNLPGYTDKIKYTAITQDTRTQIPNENLINNKFNPPCNTPNCNLEDQSSNQINGLNRNKNSNNNGQNDYNLNKSFDNNYANDTVKNFDKNQMEYQNTIDNPINTNFFQKRDYSNFQENTQVGFLQ